jgi:hypothetical protein
MSPIWTIASVAQSGTTNSCSARRHSNVPSQSPNRARDVLTREASAVDGESLEDLRRPAGLGVLEAKDPSAFAGIFTLGGQGLPAVVPHVRQRPAFDGLLEAAVTNLGCGPVGPDLPLGLGLARHRHEQARHE